jgi:hypothetical protein
MTEESSQAAVGREGCLTRISRWATAPLVIPLLTGLSFATSTVFALACFGGRGFIRGFIEGGGWGMAVILLIPGIGLGFLLRRAVMRIRDAGRFRRDIWVVVGEGLAWLVAGFVQWMLCVFLSI